MDRSDAGKKQSESLNAEEFNDSFDLLEKLGRNPSLTVRLNLVMAWMRLIDLAPSKERKLDALDKLLGIAVFSGLPSEQDKVSVAVIRELQRADADLVSEMRERLRALLHREEDRSLLRSAALLNLRSSELTTGNRTFNSVTLYHTMLQMTLQRPLFRLRMAWPILLVCMSFAAVVPVILANLAESYAISLTLSDIAVRFAFNSLGLATVVVIVTAPAHLIDRLASALDAFVCAAVACVWLAFASLFLDEIVVDPVTSETQNFLPYFFLFCFVLRLISSALVGIGTHPVFSSLMAWMITAAGSSWLLISFELKQGNIWLVSSILLIVFAIASAWVDSNFSRRDTKAPEGRARIWQIIAAATAASFVALFTTQASRVINEWNEVPQVAELVVPCNPGDTGSWQEIEISTIHRVILCELGDEKNFSHDVLVRVGVLNDDNFYVGSPIYNWPGRLDTFDESYDETITALEPTPDKNGIVTLEQGMFSLGSIDDTVLIANGRSGQRLDATDDPDPQEMWFPESIALDLQSLCLQPYVDYNFVEELEPISEAPAGCGNQGPTEMTFAQFANLFADQEYASEMRDGQQSTSSETSGRFFICLLALPISDSDTVKRYSAELETNDPLLALGGQKWFGEIKEELRDPQYRQCNDLGVFSNAATGSDATPS